MEMRAMITSRQFCGACLCTSVTGSPILRSDNTDAPSGLPLALWLRRILQLRVLDLLRFPASCGGSLGRDVPRSESSGGAEDRCKAIHTLPGLFSNSPKIQTGP